MKKTRSHLFHSIIGWFTRKKKSPASAAHGTIHGEAPFQLELDALNDKNDDYIDFAPYLNRLLGGPYNRGKVSSLRQFSEAKKLNPALVRRAEQAPTIKEALDILAKGIEQEFKAPSSLSRTYNPASVHSAARRAFFKDRLWPYVILIFRLPEQYGTESIFEESDYKMRVSEHRTDDEGFRLHFDPITALEPMVARCLEKKAELIAQDSKVVFSFERVYKRGLKDDNLWQAMIPMILRYPELLGHPLPRLLLFHDYISRTGGSNWDTEERHRNFVKVISTFGPQAEKWLAKFGFEGTVADFTKVESYEENIQGDGFAILGGQSGYFESIERHRKNGRAIHDSAQIIPNGLDKKLAQGLADFLMKNYDTVSDHIVRAVTQNWAHISDVEKKRPVRALYNEAMKRIIGDKYGDAKNLDFALECANWNVKSTDYADFELKYLTSLSIPLPKWATGEYVDGDLKGYFLHRRDTRGVFLGYYTNCCQHPYNSGRTCAWHGQTSPHGCFFIVEDKKKDIVAMSWVWEADGGTAVCFDSVEAKGLAGDRKESTKRVYLKAADGLKMTPLVTIGHGYTRIALSDLPVLGGAELPIPADYTGYRDSSSSQYVLAEHDLLTESLTAELERRGMTVMEDDHAAIAAHEAVAAGILTDVQVNEVWNHDAEPEGGEYEDDDLILPIMAEG